MWGVCSVFPIFSLIFFWKISKHALNFLYKFCFLEVNLCEMRYFKTIIFIVVRNGFEVLNSKQTVTMADYTFNYTVFSLLTTGRLTSVWTVLETWTLRDGFWCPLLAATEELFSSAFLPEPKDRLVWGSLVTCKDSTCDWGVWPSKEPASPARVSLPEAARGLPFLLLQTVAKLPHLMLSFIS